MFMSLLVFAMSDLWITCSLLPILVDPPLTKLHLDFKRLLSANNFGQVKETKEHGENK